MGTIVAIGGGMIKNFETFNIDKTIVKLTDKKNPKALFIPTASDDSEEYYQVFSNIYKDKLNCNTDVLYLIKKENIKKKILNSDLIYVGGGNSLKMIKIWKKYNVDKYLKAALENNIILSGLSAGAMCWFKYAHGDSESFSENEKWNFSKEDGLNFINAFHCPHFNEKNRQEDFKNMMKNYPNIKGIAFDNNCAIIVKNNNYKIISSKNKAKAYKIFNQNGIITTKLLKEFKEFRNFDKL